MVIAADAGFTEAIGAERGRHGKFEFAPPDAVEVFFFAVQQGGEFKCPLSGEAVA